MPVRISTAVSLLSAPSTETVCGRLRATGGAPSAPAAPPTPGVRLPKRAARSSGLMPLEVDVDVCPFCRLRQRAARSAVDVAAVCVDVVSVVAAALALRLPDGV